MALARFQDLLRDEEQELATTRVMDPIYDGRDAERVLVVGPDQHRERAGVAEVGERTGIPRVRVVPR